MPAGAPLTRVPLLSVVASYNFPSPPAPQNWRQKQQRATEFIAAPPAVNALFVTGDLP